MPWTIQQRRNYDREWKRKRRQDPEFRKRERKNERAYYWKHNKECIERARKSRKFNQKRDHDYRMARKAECVEYLGGSCQGCKETRLLVLEFHHRDPKTKAFSIATKLRWSWSFERIRDSGELDKCDLLCRNCHAIVTWGSLSELEEEMGKLKEDIRSAWIGAPTRMPLCQENDYKGRLDRIEAVLELSYGFSLDEIPAPVKKDKPVPEPQAPESEVAVTDTSKEGE